MNRERKYSARGASLESAGQISKEMPLPTLFKQLPEARAILNRYGLRGCGGHSGPAESIEFFAQAHGVPLNRLLDELETLANDQEQRRVARQQLSLDAQPKLADAIYRPFFLAAIGVMLTVGAAWGTMILWRIGMGESYTLVGIHEVNAHGHAQIMGWVILFIMGFAYQAFPRMWQTTLPAPRVAALTWLLALVGLALRGVAMMNASTGWARGLHLAGCISEVIALIGFVGIILTAFRRSQQRWQPYLAFVFTALTFMLIQAVYGAWHHDQLLAASDRESLLAQIANFQAPLRDMQIHGMALLMIVGVGLRMFPAIFGLPEVAPRRGYLVLALIAPAVVLEVSLFIGYSLTGNPRLAAGLMIPWMMLLTGAFMLVANWRLHQSLPEPGCHERSGKFIRAAFGWLLISLSMLLLLPVYQWVSTIPFSHAYFGSVRHAITVGFISMMIAGMAAKVVPTLRGVASENLPALWVPFVLINVGCALRVVCQILTDWHPVFFKIVGVSGMLEWTGFLVWGLHLAAVMLGLGKYRTVAKMSWGPAPEMVMAEHRVAQVLDWYPQLEPIFHNHGFTMLRNPVLRRTVARQVSLQQVCKMKGVDLPAFLDELNQWIRSAEFHRNESSEEVCRTLDPQLVQVNMESLKPREIGTGIDHEQTNQSN